MSCPVILHCTASHCMASHCIASHCMASHCMASHRIALHCVASHGMALRCIALQCIHIWSNGVHHSAGVHCFTHCFRHLPPRHARVTSLSGSQPKHPRCRGLFAYHLLTALSRLTQSGRLQCLGLSCLVLFSSCSVVQTSSTATAFTTTNWHGLARQLAMLLVFYDNIKQTCCCHAYFYSCCYMLCANCLYDSLTCYIHCTPQVS